MTAARPFASLEVAEAFARYPDEIGRQMMRLRELIFDTADGTEGAGEIEEALRWGQPSYLTSETGSGTTIRVHSSGPDRYGLYVHCQTDLIARFRLLYSDVLEFEGNRAIQFGKDDSLPKGPLRDCISMALTYHLQKSG